MECGVRHNILKTPPTGACQSGPCDGVGLLPVAVSELEGKVELEEQDLVVI